jgi:phospholipase C
MTNARHFAILFGLAAVAGCGGEVSGGDNTILAEFPSVTASPAPAGVRQTDWDAESVDDETRSTHLWIVNRAIGLLAARSEPQAVAAVALLGAADCRPSWHQGLADADFKAAYNGGLFDVPVGASTTELVLSGATWASHFYDPDTGLNYKGQKSPTAYDQGLAHLGNARAALGKGNRANGCYELGLSLHYFTDITQPMHSSNYTATNYPIELHSDFESYAMAQQTRFAATTWTGPTSGDASAQLLAAAHAAKPRWPTLKTAITNAYSARGCGRFSSYWTDHTNCWEGDATVDGDLGVDLVAAQQATASYLFALNLN